MLFNSWLLVFLKNFWFFFTFFGLFYFIFFLLLNEFLFVFHFFNKRIITYTQYYSLYSNISILNKFLFIIYFTFN